MDGALIDDMDGRKQGVDERPGTIVRKDSDFLLYIYRKALNYCKFSLNLLLLLFLKTSLSGC